VSYYVEATLATFYLIAYTIWQIDKWRKDKRKGGASAPLLVGGADSAPLRKRKRLPFSRRINDSFRGSLGTFLSASMLISVVMLGAGVCMSAFGRDPLRRSNSNPNQALPYLSSAIYDMVLSLMAGVFSIFPVLLLYALMGRHGGDSTRSKRKKASGDDKSKGATQPDIHRVWLRRCVLGVIWCLGGALVYLAPRGDVDYYDRHDHSADWNTDFCDQRGGVNYWRGVKAAQFLVVGAPLAYMLTTAFVVTGFGIPGLVDKAWVARWRAVWRLGIAWLNMLAMWGLLAYFTVLRHRIIKTAGGLDNEDKWSFGQILALATWVPVISEFVYIFICEFLSLYALPAMERKKLTVGITRGYRGESGHAHARRLQGVASRSGCHEPGGRDHGSRSVRRQLAPHGPQGDFLFRSGDGADVPHEYGVSGGSCCTCSCGRYAQAVGCVLR
jgi:hypothetical protein